MKEEKIIVNLYAEWDEEKGWYVNTNYSHYYDDHVYHSIDTSLIEATALAVPIVSLLGLSGYGAEEKVEGQILEQIEYTNTVHKYK